LNLLWWSSSKGEGGEDEFDALPWACYEGEDALASLRLIGGVLNGRRLESAILGRTSPAHKGPIALCEVEIGCQ
jgi:hypothetical protein